MLVLAQKEPNLKTIIKICIKIHKNIVLLTSPGQIWSDGMSFHRLWTTFFHNVKYVEFRAKKRVFVENFIALLYLKEDKERSGAPVESLWVDHTTVLKGLKALGMIQKQAKPSWEIAIDHNWCVWAKHWRKTPDSRTCSSIFQNSNRLPRMPL